ncbi:sensor histidine kinase [Cupriavidus sp. 30B13]|uniref:sensor histidine kinase n=1 Tax=Cupriavidus sp. 30B13 TaxID=3384241 RepID=UPI003B90DD0E
MTHDWLAGRLGCRLDGLAALAGRRAGAGFFWRVCWPAWHGLALACLLMARAAAADTVPLVLQGTAVSWLRDPGGHLDIAQVAAAGSFEPLRGSLRAGRSPDAFWLRVVLPEEARGSGPLLEVSAGGLADVRLYQAERGGGWAERLGGNALPFHQRELPVRGAVFRLAQPRPGDVLYLRVRSAQAMAAELRLWPEPALQAAAGAGTLGAGMYLGLMLTVVLFNVAGWLVTQRSLYGFFALFVAAGTVRWFVSGGLAGQFLFPAGPIVPQPLADALLGLQALCANVFRARLLQLRERAPRLLRYFHGMMLLSAAAMAAAFTGHFTAVMTLLYLGTLAGHLLSIPVYAGLWRTGGPAGRLIVAALMMYGAMLLPGMLGALGLVPLHAFTLRMAQLVDLPAVLALHLVIVLRMRDAERERNLARLQASHAVAASQRERDAREEQGRLLAMMAHEVRTPVAVIDAAAYSLRLLDDGRADRPDRAQRDSRYQSIRLAVRRLTLLSELAEARERMAHGEERLRAAPLDLPALSREVLATLEPRAAARIVLDVPAEAGGEALPPLAADARLLHFALLNLIDNALKYAHAWTVVRIEIAARDDMGRRGVAWRIRDRGPGVPPGKEEAIFEKFHRLDELAGHPGLGLGLPLARKIAELHGGSLRYEPDWRAGACFALWLPEAA